MIVSSLTTVKREGTVEWTFICLVKYSIYLQNLQVSGKLEFIL